MQGYARLLFACQAIFINGVLGCTVLAHYGHYRLALSHVGLGDWRAGKRGHRGLWDRSDQHQYVLRFEIIITLTLTRLAKQSSRYLVETGPEACVFEAEVIVNAAGLSASKIARMLIPNLPSTCTISASV